MGTRALEKPTRPGRNKPCPCGSGRKLKLCCPELIPLSIHQLQLIGDRLYREIRERTVAPDQVYRKQGVELFLQALASERELDDGPMGRDDRPILTLADHRRREDYLVFVHRSREAGGETGLETFVRERAGELPAAERRALRALEGAQLGLFEVTDVRRGHGIVLRDLLGATRATSYDVAAPGAATVFARWDVIAALVFPVDAPPSRDGQPCLLSIAVTAVPRELLEQVVERVRRERGDAPAGGDRVAHWQAFLAERWLELPLWILQAFDRRRQEQIESLEGVLMHHDLFDVLDVDRVLEAFDRHPDVAPDDRGGRLTFDWLCDAADLPPAIDDEDADAELRLQTMPTHGVAEDRAVLAQLELDPDGRRIEVMTLGTGRRMLAFTTIVDAMGELLSHAGHRVETFGEARRRIEAEGRRQLEAVTDDEDDLDPDDHADSHDDCDWDDDHPSVDPAAERARRRLLEKRLTSDWPRAPLDALDGKAPREAAADPRLRPRVIDLVKAMENRIAHARRAGETAWPDPKRVWSAVGIDPALLERG